MKKIMLTEKETRAYWAAKASNIDYTVKGILVDHGLIADEGFTYKNIGTMGIVMLNLTNVITMGEHITR